MQLDNKQTISFEKVIMNKKKILVIDDDVTIQDLLKNTLELNGYLVDTANNGQFGFEKAVTDFYDLVTMDIKMPRWNGLEAIASLEIVKPDLKIIVISSYLNEAENEKVGQAPNVLKLIDKPFSINDLLGVIKEAVALN